MKFPKNLSKEEIEKFFYQNVEYLRKTIPPDDIYLFAEQTFMTAMFFLYKWKEWVDVEEECKKCEVLKKCVGNLVSFAMSRDANADIKLNLTPQSEDCTDTT